MCVFGSLEVFGASPHAPKPSESSETFGQEMESLLLKYRRLGQKSLNCLKNTERSDTPIR